MKRLIFILLILFAVAQSNAQVKVGLKVSPGLNFNRTFVEQDSLGVEVDGNSPKIKVPFGFFIDIPFNERYYITTGVNLASKLSDLTYTIPTMSGTVAEEEKIKLQYIQVPVTFKLITDEIFIDKRLYFQFGPTIDILISDKSSGIRYLSKVLFGDISFLFSGGIDAKVGPNTSVCLGISYYRGLINLVKEHSLPVKDFTVKTDMLLLEIGIRP